MRWPAVGEQSPTVFHCSKGGTIQLTENPTAVSELLAKVREKDNKRLPGVHIYDLIHCARQAWYRLHFPDQENRETDADTITFLLGTGHHNLLERGEDEHRITFPVTDPYDGVLVVHGTIDNMEGSLPVEFKTTRSSSKKSPLDLPHYIDQLGAYCAVTGNTLGRLYILYINGNYAPPTPVMKAYDIEFTAAELESWRVELEARTLERASTVMPAVSGHYGWECKYCRIKEAINCEGTDKNGSYDGGFFRTLTTPWSLLTSDFNDEKEVA